MFDAHLRPMIDPPLNRLGAALAARGVTADAVTLAGCALGIGASAAIALGYPGNALALFAAGRLLDGLDGAVARAVAPSDRGGYLDIVLDFAVYAAIPFAFALASPPANALAAAALLAAIVLNGSAFLAFSVMAERRGLETRAQGQKSLYYIAGLAEGAETIAAFIAMMLWPAHFPLIAWGFAALCLCSALARIALAWRILRAP